MKTKKLSLAVSLALTCGVAMADSHELKDIEHVLVSSRVAEPIRQVATSVSVITEEDIQLRGVVSLADLLRYQAGIGVSNSGGPGAVTSVRIRGEESFRTLVRIDGVDISDPTGTQVQPQLAHQLTNNLSRVEVLRGAQGLVYGADAGGVINITSGTMQEEFAGSLAAEAGRYDTYNLNADVGGNQDGFDYYFSASDYSTDGFNRRTLDSENPDIDGYDNETYHTKLGYAINDEWSVSLVGRHTEGSAEYDGCGFGDTFGHDCVSDFEQQNLRGALNYNGYFGEHQLAYSKTLVERESFNSGVQDFFAKGNVERVEYLGQNRINESSNLVYGVDWEQENVTSSALSRSQLGYYVEYQSALQANWFVTAGLRHDDNQDFGEYTSYRLSSAYLIPVGDNEVKLRTTYGTGFRAPSLFEINYNANFGFAPATDTPLGEEKSAGFEAAVEYWTASGSTLQAIYFNQRIEDGISFDLANFSGYVQTLGLARSEGLELIADWAVNDMVNLVANYTYNDTHDVAGSQRVRRPRHLANLGVELHQDRWSGLANLRVSRDSIDAGNTPLESYEVLDLSVTYQLQNSLTLTARIENVFDNNYQEVTSYQVAGRTINAGFRYNF